MQQTYQDRLELNPLQRRCLDEFADLYSSLQRDLYVKIKNGESPVQIKSAFCAANEISSRQFNAIRMELNGKLLSTVELLKSNKQDIETNITKTTTAIANAEKALKSKNKSLDKEIRANIKVPSTESVRIIAKLKKDIAWNKKNKYGKNIRLNSLRKKLINVDERLKANVPGICFGSRKLFNQQFNLETTDFGVGEEGFLNWRDEWRNSRSHQFFLIGSKDETSGNQSCKAVIVHAPPTTEIAASSTLTLILKMPGALVEKGAPKFINFEGVRFEYGQANIIKALHCGTALSYRFHRDEVDSLEGWRVFISTDVVEQKLSSLNVDLGVVGVDFNADHLAWARTDNQGNPVNFGRINLHLHGKTTDQRDAILSDALDDVFMIACKYNNPVAIEDLDFSKKKTDLISLGVKRARMLSGLAYSKYKQLATSKASRLGVEMILVNPAYTSVAGSVKYAARLGCTVHQAAAGVIARRAQGYFEKLPRVTSGDACIIRVPLMGYTAVINLPVDSNKKTRITWVTIKRCLTQHCVGVVRKRKLASRNACKRDVSENMHHSSGSKDLLRESGELLARRYSDDSNLTDLPF